MEAKVESSTMGIPKPKGVLERDKGRAWLMLTASFICQFLVGGIIYSFSLFYIELVDYFEKERSLVGWIGAMLFAGYTLAGIAVSPLVEAHGCSTVCVLGGIVAAIGLASSAFVTSFNLLYLTFGTITGFGGGMVWYASVIIVQLWFESKRPLANGISTSGFTAGAVVLTPLSAVLFRIYNWRGACLVLAGVVLNCSVLGMLYQLIPKDTNKEESLQKAISKRNKSKNITVANMIESIRWNTLWYLKRIADFSILADPPFLIFCLSSVLLNMGTMSFVQHNAGRAVYLGVQPRTVALLPVIRSISDAICRVLTGFLGNQRRVDRCVQYIVVVVLSGMVHIASVYAVGIRYIAICTFLFGSLMGGYVSLHQTLVVDFMGIERFPRTQAVSSLSLATGMLAGPPLSGYLFDITQDYVLPFALMGSIQILSAVVLAVAKCALIHKTNKVRSRDVTK